MKFNSTITSWGPDALAFLADEEKPFIILFNEGAPDGLNEICVIHTKSSIFEAPAVDDVLVIGSKVFTITAVGDEAIHTLRDLGHCTICFWSAEEADRPGCIMVTGDEPIRVEDIKEGISLQIM